MREYGQVQCSFWSDPEIQALSDDAKLLGCYLLTGPHSNGIGCYRLPDGYVDADLGWRSERVAKGFRELFSIGFAERCTSTFYVLIPKFLHFNPITNGNVAKARIREFEAVSKKCSIYSRLCASLLEFGNHWPKGFETLLQTSSKQEPDPDPTQTLPEPDPDPNQKPVANAPGSSEPQSDSDPPVATLPLCDGTEFEITADDVTTWQTTFPAVDVMQELREMRQWCSDKPERRKTRRGVRAFVSRWLGKEQDRGGSKTGGRQRDDESPLESVQRAYREELN